MGKTMADQISLGKNGNIGKLDLSRIKAGIKKEELAKNDPRLESVFDMVDKNKDGVLDRGELDDLQQKLGNLAGEDGNLDNKEVKNFGEQKLGRKDKKALLEFLNKLDGVTPENVEKVETKLVDDKQVEVVTFKDGHTEEYYPNGQKISEVVQGNKKTKTTELNGEVTSEVVTENEGEENEIISTTSTVNGKKQTVINNKSDKTTTTINYNGDKKSDATIVGENSTSVITYDSDGNPAKEVETSGTTEKTYIYQNGQKVLQFVIENKGLEGKETTKAYDNEGGYTQAKEVGNGKITTVVDKEGNVTSNVKTEKVNGQEVSLQLDKDGNIPGVIVQNGEIPAAIAKKFGCSVDELMRLNADQLKGKGKNQYFEVGSEIKLPNTVGIEKFAKAQEGRKPAEVAKAEFQRDEQIRARKEAQRRAQLQEQQRLNKKFDQDLRKNYGLKNYSGKGSKITGKYKGGKTETFTIIGKAVYERTIVKDKKGNIHVIAKDGTILKGTYAMNTAKYQSSLLANGTRVAVVSKRKDNHNRYIALDANGKKIVVSHDGKVLKKDYIAASDDYDVNKKTQRTQTKGVGYGKAGNGKVYYFDDNNHGKAIIGLRRAEIVKKDTEFVTQQLYSSANYIFGTDEEGLQKGINNIYSREILQGVNANLKPYYSGDDQKMPVEDLILSEMSHTAARPLFKTLIDSDVMTTQEKAHTVKREIEYEVHGGITGYTSTSDLNEVMQLCTDRDVRLEIEAQFKKDHPELAENDGSVVRSYIAGDGWNAQEVDQFDANWVKTGAYQEAKYVYQTDENGDPVLDANGNPVVILDKGDQAHRNGVIGRLVFDYQDKEALNKGLDAVNDNPNSFDYQYLDQRAGEEIAKDPQGKYQSRFTNQDNVQRYLAGFHSDETGNVDAGNVSASNTCLFKGVKPARVQAEEALYNAKNGDYSQTFDSMDSETYAVMAELVRNGDVKGVKNMTDLYNKALKGAVTPNDKTKIKANAMISGQVSFTDEQIADFCVELMHSIDENKGLGGSTGISASHTNDADYQTEQLKAILQNNPQIIDAVKARVQKENFAYTTTTQTMSGSGQKPITTSITKNTKATYIQLLADTKTISKEEIFYDANGNKITDPQQIKQIKSANMQSLEQMRQYVAELERDFKKGVDAEGLLSSWGNGILSHSGMGTDRDDVATQYRNAQLMLQQFEAAAQGKLRDSDGNVISAQDLAKQMMDKQNALAETNSDYKQSVAYAKMGIVMAPVIVATTVASGGAAAAGWGTLGVAAAGGAAAGATTYGVNALEYNTSYTGNTAEAREQNMQDSLVNGVTTAVGIGQMKYIGNIANKMGTVARTGIRLGTTVAADTGVGAAAEYATTGDVSAQGTMTNMIMSGVGNAIGARSLGKKQPAPNMHPRDGVYLTQNAPVTGRNEIADAQTARNIDQSHLNGRDRQMIAREMEAQGTPTQAELDAYAKEHAYQAPTAEERAALDAHQERVRSDYSEAHRIENNATIKEQKAPTTPLGADETVIKNLENEVGALDGQIKQLNKQLAGAKRANQMGRKNGDTIKKLESQIESLQQKRTAKAAELETARKPVEVKADEVKPDVKPNEDASVTGRAAEETPKVEVKSETIISDANSINTSDIPAQHQLLWKTCKERLEKLTQELSMSTIMNPKELLARGKELLAHLKTIADSVTNSSIKAKIQKIAGNLKSMLTSKTIEQNAFKPVKTVEEANKLYDKLVSKRWIGEDGNDSNLVFIGGGWTKALYKNKNFKQGTPWKIHIYADSPQEWANAAQVAMPYLEKNSVTFKTVNDLDSHFQTLREYKNSEGFHSQTGKAFTVYFESEEEFLRVAQGLEARFKESGLKSSGTVANEAQIGDSGFLSYRHEGAERGTMYKPEGIEDPYLKKFGSQDSPVQAKEVQINEMRQPTPQEKMEMGQIGNNINRAKTADDLVKAQQWLDKMPECPQKSRLQAQLNEKANTINPQSNNVYIMDLETNDVQLVETDVKLQRGTRQKVSSMESVRLGDQVDINFADFEAKFNAMRDGDSFIIGREVSGANDIRINNEFVSGQHLKVEKINGEIYITDMSRNGTTLNSTKPDYAAQYSPQLQQKFANANYGDFTNMINDNYRNLRRANYSLEESVSGNITNADLANDANVNIYESGGWFFRYQKGHRPVDASRVADRISLNVVADKNLLAELDRLCATGTYVNANGQTVRVNMPDCTYKTPQSLQGYTTRHDPITMYFEREVSEDVQNAIADIAGKYARQSSNGKSLMNALEGKPYIAHEAYTSPKEAQALWKEAEQLNPSLADAIHQELNDDGTWNCSTGQFAACKKLIDEYKLSMVSNNDNFMVTDIPHERLAADVKIKQEYTVVDTEEYILADVNANGSNNNLKSYMVKIDGQPIKVDVPASATKEEILAKAREKAQKIVANSKPRAVSFNSTKDAREFSNPTMKRLVGKTPQGLQRSRLLDIDNAIESLPDGDLKNYINNRLSSVKKYSDFEEIELLINAHNEMNGTTSHYMDLDFQTMTNGQVGLKRNLSDNAKLSRMEKNDGFASVHQVLESDARQGGLNRSQRSDIFMSDIRQNERMSSAIEYMSKYPNNEMSEKLYSNYIQNRFANNPEFAARLNNINKEYGVKIIVPSKYSTNSMVETTNYVEAVLAEFKNASNGQAKLPPVIDFGTAKPYWYSTKGTFGMGMGANAVQHGETGSLGFHNMDEKTVKQSLKHELTHANDLGVAKDAQAKHNFDEIFPRKTIVEYGKMKEIPDISKAKYADEFRAAGLPEDKILYAHNNPQEYIAVASEGDISKYSEEFKQVLIDLGMPEWRFRM